MRKSSLGSTKKTHPHNLHTLFSRYALEIIGRKIARQALINADRKIRTFPLRGRD